MEAQLRSEDMRMVMDASRNAKGFHATVGFIVDTGFKVLKCSGCREHSG